MVRKTSAEIKIERPENTIRCKHDFVLQNYFRIHGVSGISFLALHFC